jgi:hypothetical protein
MQNAGHTISRGIPVPPPLLSSPGNREPGGIPPYPIS